MVCLESEIKYTMLHSSIDHKMK